MVQDYSSLTDLTSGIAVLAFSSKSTALTMKLPASALLGSYVMTASYSGQAVLYELKRGILSSLYFVCGSPL
jgi:hypothetical protein